MMGSSGCALAFSLLALLFAFLPPPTPQGESQTLATGEATAFATIFLVLGFCAIYSLSWGPLAFLLPSEMVPTDLRARVASVGIVSNFLVDFAVVGT